MLHGIAVSDGIGIGNVMLLEEHSLLYDETEFSNSDMEVERLNAAMKRFCKNTTRQVERLRRSAGQKDALILESHIGMASDPVLGQEIRSYIREHRCRAETALKEICRTYIDTFSRAHDELTRLRAEDIRDICHALLCLLLGVEDTDVGSAPKDTILVAKELTPSVMSSINARNIVGIITERGAAVSHASILARTMGIPTVCGVAGAMEKLVSGACVIVDGSKGDVLYSLDEPVIADYRRRCQAFREEHARMAYFKDRRTLSADGDRFSLYGNINMPSSAAAVIRAGGEGVGLFRTEYLYMNRQTPPGEEEQVRAYSIALQGAQGRPVTIRTLDISGDKEIPCLDSGSTEANSFLGLRGLRWCLAHEDVFMTQLRALLRAGAGQNLRIMIPMVSSLEEIRAVRNLLGEARDQLRGEGKPYAQQPRFGVMIETPAAVMMAEQICQNVDFISIGTNDLTGYIMACDRANPAVAALASPFQPAVLRALHHVVCRGVETSTPVTVCGVAACDPKMIPLLMAFGISGFSVPATFVTQVRRSISQWDMAEAAQLAESALALDTLAEVETLLSAAVAAKG